MTINLSPEDQEKVEALIASGRFTSIAEALHAGLERLEWELRWSAEIQACIDAGVEAAAQNDFVDNAELDSLFSSYERKSA